MSIQRDVTCPLCTEAMDLTDQHFKPCKCGYQVRTQVLFSLHTAVFFLPMLHKSSHSFFFLPMLHKSSLASSLSSLCLLIHAYWFCIALKSLSIYYLFFDTLRCLLNLKLKRLFSYQIFLLSWSDENQ